jgi:excisionase family DNA binding protein
LAISIGAWCGAGPANERSGINCKNDIPLLNAMPSRRPQPDSEFITTQEAATLLGVSLRTVQVWVESGALKAWKTAGGHRRVVRKTVDQMVRERDAVVRSVDAPPEKFRILLVEDDEPLRKLSDFMIESWDLPIELDMAANGFDGLMKIGQQMPDLLITDLNMPGMDGVRMIQSIRRQPASRELAIVVVTALNPSEIKELGPLPADLTVYTKPIPWAQLEARVRQGIAQRQAAGREALPA